MDLKHSASSEIAGSTDLYIHNSKSTDFMKPNESSGKLDVQGLYKLKLKLSILQISIKLIFAYI